MKRYFVTLMLLVVFVLPAVAQDSLNVSLVGSLEGDWDKAKVIDIVGTYAYVASGSTGLVVVDISDPATPEELGDFSYEPPNSVLDVTADGNYAYLAVGNLGLRVIDVTDPTEPTEVGFYLTPSAALGVDVQGSYVYVADRWGGLRVIDVSDPTLPVEEGFYDTPGDAFGVTVAGDYAYVANFYEGLRIIDVTDPAAPFEVGFYDTPGNARCVAVAGDYAYVADGSSGLLVIDIFDPTAPIEVGSYDTATWAYYVAVAGDYAYVADGSTGLRVIDVLLPTVPAEVGFYDTMGISNGVAVVDGLAYVADDDYFGIYDCGEAVGISPLIEVLLATDVPLIVPAGEVFEFDATIDSDMPGQNMVDIWSEAILPDGSTFGMLWLITLSMGPNTIIVAENIVQPVPGIAPAGYYGYRTIAGVYPDERYAWDQFGFEIVQTSFTASSDQGWTTYGWEEAFGVAIAEANDSAALPLEYSISAAYPNPFNPSTTISVTLPETANLTVRAFNVNGQQVAELASGQFTAGSHALIFDASGLASGLYFVHATVPGQLNQVQKVMLVR